MLSAEILEEIENCIRTGIHDRSEVIEIFCEELHEQGELDEEQVRAAVDLAMDRYEAEKAAWPEVTDCDRLDRAFARLEGLHILAIQNAGMTQSDGHDCYRSALIGRADRDSIRGYCFYHGQDLERAVTGGGLCLAFGPADPRLEESEGPVIGSIIVQVLEEEGLTVDWNGTFQQRIHLPEMDWKKR